MSLLYDEIESNGCKISARYERPTSSHEFLSDGCIMRVCLKDIYVKPIEIIWSMIHELGHHISGRPDKYSDKISREKLAWELGRSIATKFPELALKIDDYNDYARICVQTYIDAEKAVAQNEACQRNGLEISTN